MDQNSFIALIKNGAIIGRQSKGVPTSLTIAQAILESGWGDHAPGNNLFGIKAGAGWAGKTQVLNTSEYINGREVPTTAVFKEYDTLDESIEDHTALLAENARYANVLHLTDAEEACRLILQDGYATEPDYADKLIELIRQYNLTQYDAPAPVPAPAPTPTPAPAPVAPATKAAYVVVVPLHGFLSADDAASGANPRNVVQPGTYSVFNESAGMINVTQDSEPGSWINPSLNHAAAPTTQATVTFKAGKWYLRGGPATHFAAVGILNGGKPYTLLGTTADGWSHIKTDDETGYVGPAAK